MQEYKKKIANMAAICMLDAPIEQLEKCLAVWDKRPDMKDLIVHAMFKMYHLRGENLCCE